MELREDGPMKTLGLTVNIGPRWKERKNHHQNSTEILKPKLHKGNMKHKKNTDSGKVRKWKGLSILHARAT